jgi:hypothetical protein
LSNIDKHECSAVDGFYSTFCSCYSDRFVVRLFRSFNVESECMQQQVQSNTDKWFTQWYVHRATVNSIQTAQKNDERAAPFEPYAYVYVIHHHSKDELRKHHPHLSEKKLEDRVAQEKVIEAVQRGIREFESLYGRLPRQVRLRKVKEGILRRDLEDLDIRECFPQVAKLEIVGDLQIGGRDKIIPDSEEIALIG